MKPARARRASLPSILARMTRRVIRSTRVPTSEPLRAPLIKSPSQWPGTVRVATSAGHSAMGVKWGICRVDRSPVPEAGVPCAPDAAPPTVRCSGCRRAAHTSPHRWSRPRGVSPCRQDTRVEGARQSALANSRRPDALSPTATARVPGVCGVAVAAGPGRSPTCVPYRHDRGGPAWCCGPAHGAGGASQHSGHRPERMAMGQAHAQRLTVFRTHVSIESL